MKYLILSAIASTHFFVFSAAYEKLKDDAPCENVQHVVQSKVKILKIQVTPHENAMERQIANRWLDKDTMYVCLVADSQLQAHFPDMNIAQKVVDALPNDITGFGTSDAARIQRVADDQYLPVISKEALLAGKGKAALTAIIIIGRSDPEKKRPYIKIFFNGREASLWWPFTKGTLFFSCKLDAAGKVKFEYPRSVIPFYDELKRRGESRSKLWEDYLSKSDYDFHFKISGSSYFKQPVPDEPHKSASQSNLKCCCSMQ